MGVGTTFIEHAPTASFPSNHMLIFSTIALSYLFAQRKIIGIILFIFIICSGVVTYLFRCAFPFRHVRGFLLSHY